MGRNILIILGLCLFLIGCAENDSQDTSLSESEKEDDDFKAMEKELEEMEEEIERLKLMEEIYMEEKASYADISLNVSTLINSIKEMDTGKIEDYLHPEATVKEIDNEIYFINDDFEFKMTYNNEEQQLEKWFVESITLTELNEAEVLVRTHYLDKNQESVKEDRPFGLTFTKKGERWLLSSFAVV